MTKTVDVLLPLPVDKLFTYLVKEESEASIGDYVIVPFGNRKLIGIVWQYSNITNQKLKSIERKINLPSVEIKLRWFAGWVAQYNLIPIGMLAKMIMGGVLKVNSVDKLNYIQQEHKVSKVSYILNFEQQIASNEIKNNLNKYSVILLDGETGSGKTAVYLSIVSEVVANTSVDAQVLILLPEIILASQLVSHIGQLISGDIVEWHSNLSIKTRKNNWMSIISGHAQIIIGARSALFLPYKNLKLIIVDEEHDSSFKQEQSIIYNARDMAIALAKNKNIPIILSSATPSLEAIYHVKHNNYIHVRLTKRFNMAVLPQIKIVEMQNSKQWISDELFECIVKTIEKKQQVLLFLNRRGYAQLAVCKKCGHKLRCTNCAICLVYHREKNILLCHYCSYRLKLPEQCINCKDREGLLLCGVGIEKIFEEIAKLIPNAKTAIISSDQKSLGSIIDTILNGEVNIIIGTQIIAKGHNFPKLTLVGIIDADLGLENADLRAAERTYQLLHQVSGRSGRFDEKGRVIIQTNNAQSTIIKALKYQERNLFYEHELESRNIAKMPPFSRLIALIITGRNQATTHKLAILVAKSIPCSNDFEVLGPSTAAISFLKNRYRYRILLKVYNRNSLFVQKNLKSWMKKFNQRSITIDVDPVNFL